MLQTCIQKDNSNYIWVHHTKPEEVYIYNYAYVSALLIGFKQSDRSGFEEKGNLHRQICWPAITASLKAWPLYIFQRVIILAFKVLDN